MLFWVCNGTFRLRAASLESLSHRVAANHTEEGENQSYPHPHPQYAFAEVLTPDRNPPAVGFRLRTVMVSNVPAPLRSEKELKEYFEYYMSRKIEKPSLGLTSSTQPGVFNKSFAFVFNRAKRLPAHLPHLPIHTERDRATPTEGIEKEPGHSKDNAPVIERVVVARKMTELASLLERREDILRLLETAHIKLANKSLQAVKAAMERQGANKPFTPSASRATEVARKRRSIAHDPERGDTLVETLDEEGCMKLLIETLGPFVGEFDLQAPLAVRSKSAITKSTKRAFRRLRTQASEDSDSAVPPERTISRPRLLSSKAGKRSLSNPTIWDALLSLPRDALDPYQPLVNLSHLFRGKVVPSIDYYTTKLNLLTSLITENRAKAASDFDAVSTAFVTFRDPADARRACKYLAVHPNNPMNCLVTMAPMYQDIDWIRVMKSSLRVEVCIV